MDGSRCLQTPAITTVEQQVTSGPPSVEVNASDTLLICVDCFFPHHCLANNTCLTGTTGPDCEVCQNPGPDGQGYQMVGSSCVTCSQVPVAAVSFAIFLIMLLLCLALTKIPSAAATKMKILVNFVQLVYLAMFVKVKWSPLLGQLISVLSFSTFTSDIAMMECLLPDVKFSSYMRWLTAVAIPSLIVCVGSCIDRGFRKRIKTSKRESVRVKFEKKRSEMRYFLFLVVMFYYMPVSLSAVQSFSCSSTFGRMIATSSEYTNVYLYDPSVSCEGFLFQTFNFILTLFMLAYIVLLPLLLIFFTLRQRKWALLECKSAKYGFVYDSYTHRFCFWESLAMVRKVASIGVTSTLLTDPFLQSIVLLSISGFYLLLLLAARPYRKCYWRNLSVNVHVLLDVVCTLSLCVVNTGALLLALNLYPEQLDFLLLAVILLALVVWLVFALAGRLERMDSNRGVTFEDSMEVTESVISARPQTRIKRNQVGEYITSLEVDRRAAQVEF